MKKVVLLGSTGSVGTSTCKVADDIPEAVQLIGLAAGRNVTLLSEQISKYHPIAISIADPNAAKEFANDHPGAAEVHCGEEDLIKILQEPKNSLVKQYAHLFEMEGVELDLQLD